MIDYSELLVFQPPNIEKKIYIYIMCNVYNKHKNKNEILLYILLEYILQSFIIKKICGQKFYCKFTVLNFYLQDTNDYYNFFFRYIICLEESLDKMSNVQWLFRIIYFIAMTFERY